MAEVVQATPLPTGASEIPAEAAERAAQEVRTSAKRTREIFAADFAQPSALVKAPQPAVAPQDPSPYERAQKASVAARIRSEYADVKELPAALAQKQASAASGLAARRKKPKTEEQASDPQMAKVIEDASSSKQQQPQTNGTSMALTRIKGSAASRADASPPWRSHLVSIP